MMSRHLTIWLKSRTRCPDLFSFGKIRSKISNLPDARRISSGPDG